MLRLIIFFAVLFVIALGGAWLADRPGSLVLDWQGYRLETSLMIAVVSLIGLIVALFFVYVLLTRIIGSPGAFLRFWGNRRRQRGLRALTQGLIAVGAGDSRMASRMSRDASKLLKNEPATKLLSAQAAQLAGETDSARETFTDMLDSHSTQLLGLHGLYIEARRQGETVAARHYAEEAVAIAPSLPWAGKAVFEFQSAESDWEGALASLERNANNKLLDKKTMRRQRAVLLTARALELEDGSPDRARTLAREAHNLAPDLVPAAAVAGRLYARSGDFGKAAKILEAAWRKEPHPELAEAYIHIRPGDSARDRLKRAETLTRMRAHHPEGAMALARVAIDVNDWSLARESLTKVLRSAPTQRACLLMADVEEGEHGDQGRVREWLARAVRAPRDPVWIADNVVSEHWAPVSPVTGRLDAFEWKVPVAGLAAPDGDVIDEELLAPRAPIAAPAAVAVAAPVLNETPTPEPQETPPAEAEPEQVEDAATPDEEPASGTETVAEPPTEIAEAEIVEEIPPTKPAEETSEAADRAPEPEAATSTESAETGGASAETTPEAKENEPATDKAATEPAANAGDEPASADAEKTSDTDKEETGPKLVTFPLGHAPDDPGPTGEEEDEPKGRFKLFS